MAHTSVAAELAAARAEITALRAGFEMIRSYVTSDKFLGDDPLAGLVRTSDVSMRILAALMSAEAAHDAAMLSVNGPVVASGGCADSVWGHCAHEPSLRPNAWHCPVCAYLLTSDTPSRDSDTKAQERMRQHWVAMHRVESAA